jgi:phospholipid N-methyltransferase
LPGLLPEWDEFRVFGRMFLRHPLMLGSAFPSSSYLVEHLLSRVEFSRAQTIVEYGPGVGTFTQHLLARMRRDARLIVIETNAEFVRILKERLPDNRLHPVHGSAADVAGILQQFALQEADYIISGIPFTTLPDDLRGQILAASRDVLSKDGAFLVYQYTRAVLPQLRSVFTNIICEFEPRNILPAQVFFCEP